jgi:phenylalanyl-tRNA synthetase beta chain
VDYFDVKGVIEALARMFGVPLDTVPADRPFLAPGRAAEAVVTIDGAARQFAVLGQLAPALAAARGGAEQDAVYVAEIDLGLFADEPGGDGLRAASLPRFPSIVRDLSMLFDDTLPAAAVRGTIRSAAPETLVSITEFDRYQGKGVPEGKISLSLRLLFRAADRTLTDDEVQGAMDGIVEALRAAHGGERR